jgi:1-deoxy-D-xylulose-5-phosphate reductoisomerase
MTKGLALLGSTGSIGTATLDVVARHPDAFRVVALTGGRNVDRLVEQAHRFRPELVVVRDEPVASALRGRVPAATRILHGRDGLIAASRHDEASIVVCALVGALGVEPAFAAVDAGKDVALANKEALVAAGEFVIARARETGSTILPVDSEHNAIHQCLRGEDPAEIKALWLTASGGPFRCFDRNDLAGVTPEQALKHPTWVMGPKITIDSATLMNKGLEVVEARWLFGVGPDRIRVVVHPKSVVHSLVEFADGSFKAQLGVTDMRHPIQYALTYPARLPSMLRPFDLVAAGALEFAPPDLDRFPCLAIAYEALARGGAAPAVMNAANEIAVQAFLERRAGFLEIPATIRHVLARCGDAPADSLHDILDADRLARETAAKVLDCGVKP